MKPLLNLKALLSFLLISASFFCFSTSYAGESPSPIEPKKNYDLREALTSEHTKKNILFVESSIEKGLIFEHNERDFELSGLKDTLGSGVCIIDVDNDGYNDVFAVGGRGVTRRYGKQHWWHKNQSSKLFHNIKGLYFSDITKTINAELISGYGCATGDINNDGYADIVIGGKGNITLLINDSGKAFSKQVIALDNNVWPMSITLWDANQDNYLDILVANFAQFTNDIGYQSHSSFDSENFSGQQNLLLTNKTSSQKDNTINFTIASLEGYDKSLSITPLSLLGINLTTTPEALLIANAKGSTSFIQPSLNNTQPNHIELTPWLNALKVPLVQASSIYIKNHSALLLTQHKTGGFQLYETNKQVADDLSWQLGINSNKDNISPTWATLIADINNDGMEDIISAKGFSTPHIDNPFKPQGSRNTFKRQTLEGTFTESNVFVRPNLVRASKGAAFADFNNDGLLDIVFNNNNNQLSLYINKSAPRDWLSLICLPLHLCEGSTWHVINKQEEVLSTKHFSSHQPFLSSNQKRLHFSFNHLKEKVNISIHLKNDKVITYSDIDLNTIYTINVLKNSISSHASSTNTAQIKPSFSYLVNAPLNELLPSLAKLPLLSPTELLTLTQYIQNYKLANNNAFVLSPEFITLTSWLLNKTLQNTHADSELLKAVIHLIGQSESSLFADHIVYLIDILEEDNFCQLTTEINQWFQEEETATKSKQLFKAPLVYKILQSRSAKEIICGLNAISISRDTTLGYSLLTLLHNKDIPLADLKSVQAATIRTFGFLKNNRVSSELLSFCEKSTDDLIIAECIISLSKLNTSKQHINNLLTKHNISDTLLTFHPDKIILAPLFKQQEVTSPLISDKTSFSVKNYLSSSLLIHSTLAHLVNLTSAKNDTARTQAINHLMLINDKKTLMNIARRWHALKPSSINDYFFLPNLPNEKLYWLLPFASNTTIKRIVHEYSRHESTFQYNYALAQQCNLRGTIKQLCNNKFSVSGYINTEDIKSLVNNNVIKLLYILLSDDVNNITKKKITVTTLFNYSSTLVGKNITQKQGNELELVFTLLRINHLYTLINKNKVSDNWLNKFIDSSLSQYITLDKTWLEQYTIKNQQTHHRITLIKSTH